MTDMLSDENRRALMEIHDSEDVTDARRAQIILMSDAGNSPADIAAAVGISARQVYYWRRAWRERGLAIFGSLKPDQPSTAETAQDDGRAAVVPDSPTGPGTAPEVRPGIDVPRLPVPTRDAVGVFPDDPMAEAGRKVLLVHFERMLLYEPGSRLGQDIEAVHDMRVATRRMRSALRLFGPFYEPETLRYYRRHLRSVAYALGEVRDLDVFMDKAQQYVRANPATDLTPLFAAWEIRLADSRDILIAELDRKKTGRFIQRFHAFLTTPGEGALSFDREGPVTATQVRHVAPRLIYELFEQVRAYDTVLENASLTTLHALRIDFKRLRYALEFFEEVLGRDAKAVIQEVKGMQDHLGDLNDTRFAAEMLREFVVEASTTRKGKVRPRPDLDGVGQYIAFQESEQARLVETLPAAWAHFSRPAIRTRLARAIGVL